MQNARYGRNTPFARKRTAAAYDLQNNHWIKKPKPVQQEEVEALIKGCSDHYLLTNLIAEYKKLESLVAEFEEAENKAKASEVVTNTVSSFVDIYKELIESRREFYEKKQPKADTCIAVVFKIAESYGFGKIYKIFKELLEE